MPKKRITAPEQRADRQNYAKALSNLGSFSISIRKCALAYNLPYSSLQRLTQRKNHNTPTRGRGRKTIFTSEEKQLIKASVLSFSHRGMPLSRNCLKNLVQDYVRSLPQQRKTKLPFRNDRPGDGFVRNLIRRHPDLSLKRRSQMEKPRQLAMSPTNLAQHFARLKQVFKEYKVTKPDQVFNTDESGFSTRTASQSRAKAVFDAKERSNSVELNWAANAQHVTMMPVVSADGRAWIPLAVLPGKQAKLSKRHDGTRKTPSTFLPPTAYCVYREKAGVDTDIFYHWGEKFVEETSLLRKRHRNIILALDGYGAHCSYKFLQLFKDNNIVFVGLPAHTSHRTQPLDFSVFSPYKTAFRNEVNKRTIFVKDETKNDVYTICELLTNAYYQAVNVQNITSGFQACGLWDNRTGGIDADFIKATDITNLEGAESQSAAIKTYHDLVQSFSASVNLLRSDGDVLVNGTLNTTTGLLLTEERVLTELQEREEERRQAEKEKKERASQAEANRLARQRELAEKQKRRVQAEVEKQAHLAWLALRGERARILAANRSVRRSTARLRARSGGAVTSDFH